MWLPDDHTLVLLVPLSESADREAEILRNHPIPMTVRALMATLISSLWPSREGLTIVDILTSLLVTILVALA